MSQKSNGPKLIVAGVLGLSCVLGLGKSWSYNVNLANQARAIGQETKKELPYRDLAAAREALRRDPNNAWARIRVAESRIDAHDKPGAIRELRLALQSEPGNGKAAWLLGLLLHKSGQREEARRVMQDLAARGNPPQWSVGAQESLDKWKATGEE